MRDDSAIPVDLSLMADILDGNMLTLQKLIGHMLETYPSQLKAIGDSIIAGDALKVRRLSHTFKGSMSNFHARAAVKLALGLEQCGAAGDLKSAPDVLRQLEEEMHHIKKYFERNDWKTDLGNALKSRNQLFQNTFHEA